MRHCSFWQSFSLTAPMLPSNKATPPTTPPMMPSRLVLEDSLVPDVGEPEPLLDAAGTLVGADGEEAALFDDAGALVGADGDTETDGHTVEPCWVAEGHNVQEDGLMVFANDPTGHITHLLKKGSLSKNACAAQ